MLIAAAGIIIQRENGEILILHRKEDVLEGNKWGIPGGKTTVGEKTVETAIRKTTAETGLAFDEPDLIPVGEFHYQSGDNDIDFTVYLAKVTNPQLANLKLNRDGHTQYDWVNPNELVKKDNLMVGMYPILNKFNQTFR